MVVETSDKDQFSYVYVLNPFLKLTRSGPTRSGETFLSILMQRICWFKGFFSVSYGHFLHFLGNNQFQMCIMLENIYCKLTIGIDLISYRWYNFEHTLVFYAANKVSMIHRISLLCKKEWYCKPIFRYRVCIVKSLVFVKNDRFKLVIAILVNCHISKYIFDRYSANYLFWNTWGYLSIYWDRKDWLRGVFFLDKYFTRCSPR